MEFAATSDMGVRERGGNAESKMFVLSYYKNGVVIYWDEDTEMSRLAGDDDEFHTVTFEMFLKYSSGNLE